ncbi:MAG: T9SS type A sorting domain-containing protein [Prevotella sp.]|nr:T9SS type A sorting domain-containing protein [Prevotella sp.]
MLHNITAGRWQKRLLLALSFFIFHLSFSVAQTITIGGNVYGGGKSGNLSGSTKVTILAGDLNEVYGGAQMAKIGGQTFVHIDGEHASDDIFIVNVYGGNDISGTIGEGSVATTVPEELENIRDLTDPTQKNDKTKNTITNTTKSFIRTTACPDTETFTIEGVTVKGDSKMLVVGSLFGGSNGDYDYNSQKLSDNTDNPYYGLAVPELSSTYLEIKGGCIAHVYGGGNNATVNDSTLIHIENGSCDLQSTAALYAYNKAETKPSTLAQLKEIVKPVIAGFQSKVTMATFQSNLNSWAFNHARVFGGNNKAPMYIMPSWNLQKGIIRDLFSGGNEGSMLSESGLLLEIDPAVDPETGTKDKLEIVNVYGGCRRADVRPMKLVDGAYQEVAAVLTKGNYKFPKGLAARTLVRGGKIHNVYGGNDISGDVVGGNAVGIYSDILGDVYGGGNGSYAYTDNATLGTITEYKDFYYNPGSNSVAALNEFRPNAEQVSIRLAGTEENPITIWGSVYVGGNSATLKKDNAKVGNPDYPKYPLVELKIGSYVTANNVFLGNNGENMIDSKADGVLAIYARTTNLVPSDYDYTTLDLTDKDVFAEYMKGCAMDMIPNVVFDNSSIDPADYKDYTSKFGSFYCGGNVGSMIGDGLTKIDFDKEVVIFDKFVGGCNNANVDEQTIDVTEGETTTKKKLNARYEGGVTGTYDDETGNKIELNLSGLRIEPRRWIDENNKKLGLEWNTYVNDVKDVIAPKAVGSSSTESPASTGTSSSDDLARRFQGGNIYGGCYSSGRVNGNVVINLNGTIVKHDVLFDVVQEDDNGEAVYYNNDNYKITKRNTGVIIGQQGMDVLGKSLNVFGGGKGKDTEIWGSTTINLNAGYTFQIFGGSEEGVIGKSLEDQNETIIEDGEGTTKNYDYVFNGKHYAYSPAYSCYVNLKGDFAGVTKTSTENSPLMADCEFMYGGGFFGPICGNTIINMGKGRVFNSFAGSCMADILGHTETYIGRMVKDEYQNKMGLLGSTEGGLDNDMYYEEGFPWVRDITYGGNDLGGKILGTKDFKHRVRSEVSGKVYNPDHQASADVLTASAYTEYLQGRADGIFGGCYGTYDYTEPRFSEFFNANGTAKTGYSKPRMDNAFVNFRPTYTAVNNEVGHVYGAGQGYSGEAERDVLQDRSYILIDVPQDMTYYKKTEVFGAGAWGGVGMREYLPSKASPTPEDIAELDKNSAIIDLVRGQIGAAYGGSYKEGVTRRSVVNVPSGSTIVMGSIFGGAYGTDTYLPCDVYEANVNFNSSTAKLIHDPGYSEVYQGNIYGGNNNERRTFYGRINIDVPVVQDKVIQYDNEIDGWKKGAILTTKATVFGAGRGKNTWSEYTEVNLKSGAEIYEVYGGGQDGKVYNAESVTKFMSYPAASVKPTEEKDYYDIYKDYSDEDWATVWANAWKIGSGYDPASGTAYWESTNTNLANLLVRVAEVDDRDFITLTAADLALVQNRYNTNVIINRGATVNNYAYGGGLGSNAVVSGTTYIALLGGTVKKDIYAAGTSGAVQDATETGNYASGNRAGFMASANAYVEGGIVRNVYGGGWEGDVGKHQAGTFNGQPFPVAGRFDTDVLAETHVVIGKLGGTSLYNGIPAISRNVYGGGEGGPVYGSSYVKIHNGYIGYVYNPDGTDDPETDIDEHYEEKIHDETWEDGVGLNRLLDSGCVFGAGYVDNSNVDFTNVYLYGGYIRNSVFGGGEIAAVGRGKIELGGEENSERQLKAIFKGGKTMVEMYDGTVKRNVFAGGRGYNNLGQQGKLYSDGYVFGKTEVHVHGGEIGTEEGLLNGDGNVFGGGDIGYVYSAYQNAAGALCVGKKSGTRFDDGDEGFYYKNEGGTFAVKDSGGNITNDGDGVYKDGSPITNSSGGKYLTEDCKVLVEPFCRVKEEVTFENIFYPKDATVSHLDLEYLKKNNISLTGLDANGNVTAVDGYTITSRTYSPGEYVPAYALNTLKSKNDYNKETGEGDSLKWICLDDKGIIIHNAVFAGGNTSPGSAAVYANATSVFGNATASIHDVYHRDLITLGTGHTGGLYGDGNLTFVDGYRGLNITNYGTDYYNIQKEIDIDAYHALPAREAAYYELRYLCVKECTDKDGTHYTAGSGDSSGSGSKASTITADDFFTLFEGVQDNGVDLIITDATGKRIPNPAYWKENGVCSRYAGRLMNSIQRADFCGVFGSRMVMQGAQDRVPETVDYTNYTINRVGEVSLNKAVSRAGDAVGSDGYEHGNYFGIFSVVNFLGALTSDVRFDSDVRTTDNADTQTYGPQTVGQTFYNWKKNHAKEKSRNNGNSHNKVALASGVYLELTTEKSTGKGLNEKDWGLITGVIELDLINVQQGIGGGFVYAKNVHGIPTYSKKDNITLTALNRGAITSDDFTYVDVPTYENTDDPSLEEFQTSGNFVHSTQTIIDDCYNVSAKYKGAKRVPAHYWYIKGSVYVYDQYISAYTGNANAYPEAVEIPLVITAASHGEMKLMKVKQNLYAYNSAPGVPLEEGQKVVINDVAYQLNDPINYWDWYMLTPTERRLFVPETYVSVADCEINGTTYPAGTVLLPSEYESLRPASGKVHHVEKNEDVDYEYVFRSSNNLSHNTGYMLTYDMNNPAAWDKWYTPETGSAVNDKLSTAAYNKQSGYNNGPTYHLKTGETASLLGQRSYSVSNLISKDVYTGYEGFDANGDEDYDDEGDIKGIKQNHPEVIPATGQASFAPAYIVTAEVLETTKDGNPQKLYKDATVAQTGYTTAEWSAMSGSIAPAYICNSSIKLNETDYIYINTCMTEAQKTQYLSAYTDETIHAAINEHIVPAYYCTSEGLYGGNYYEQSKNYRGLEAWSSMSETDREKFTFNYDALDLLIDPTFCEGKADGQQYQYDGEGFTTEAEAKTNKAGYSLAQPVDYTATYNGNTSLTYTTDKEVSATATAGTELSRTEYERLLNEQRHYSPIAVKEAGTYYVVKTEFIRGDSPYAVGQSISEEEYYDLSSDEKGYIQELTFTEEQKNNTYYYCREGYTIATTGGMSVTNVSGISTDTYSSGDDVPKGIVITKDNYSQLTNNQKSFTIHGISPVETSTLYVSRYSDINDLSKEKIITVIYEYNYEESTTDGMTITPVSERHVVNIHIQFKSGIPEVEDITKPKIILPGTGLSLREPNVKPGAYEVTGGGWTLFDDYGDAESHVNGMEYTPGQSLLYWYQNNYYIAYYAKTILGKTYSNAVPVSVANYHDLHEVMSHKDHHMYVDHPDVLRDSKIYINDYSYLTDDTDPRKNQNGLDLLKDFFDLSLQSAVAASGPTEGHALLNNHVEAGENLEFFLRSDLAKTDNPNTDDWTPIGESTCFEGVLHGDGHTISGLDHSLFDKLCGSVYNLGVTGSFTGGGVANEGRGYAENCWVMTTGTPAADTKAIIGNPNRGSGTQIVNCYYPESNAAFDATNNGRGIARKMPDEAFYNGEVAYDLNGFYLYKRYYDNNTTWTGDKTSYNYLPTNDDGTLPDDATEAKYPTSTFTFYQPEGVTAKPAPYLGYVESRYYDGDFQYAGGTIPESDRRRRTATVSVLNQDNTTSDVETDVFYPIWPDDYLFFGQMLTYGHVDGRAHQDTPSFYSTTNRVYRAPAYFRDSKMDVAHFNPDAVFSQTKKGEASVIAYKGMTAIDFTGYNDVSQGYQSGVITAAPYNKTMDGAFYPPLLDDDGLTSLTNVDLTRNLLVYTGTPGTSASGKTGTVVSKYLPDEAYVETNDDYHTVAPWDSPSDKVKGHWVEYDGADYTAPLDHVLVDKQDFNAPIGYTFDSDYRMWYQRLPGNYVGKKKPDGTFIANNAGWDAISLPFKAEIVTTDVKGEITHFYGGSKTATNSNAKIGHEYWLREFRGGAVSASDSKVFEATFNYPGTNSDDGKKAYTNTFLWDYYYSYDEYRDRNADEYQEDDAHNNYYRYAREYDDYPRLANAKPYIIGFPGERYYEFDLSGAFKVTTAYSNPDKLNAQTITFASKPGATINVSDTEINDNKASSDGYTFLPSYLNETLESVELGEGYASKAKSYALNADGNAYIAVTRAEGAAEGTGNVSVAAFRPYFTSVAGSSPSRQITRSIVFSQLQEEEKHLEPRLPGYISARPGRHKIITTSTLEETVTVRIVSPSGLCIATFDLQPGESRETHIVNSGVYIVQSSDGKYTRKLSVR